MQRKTEKKMVKVSRSCSCRGEGKTMDHSRFHGQIQRRQSTKSTDEKKNLKNFTTFFRDRKNINALNIQKNIS
jgi:hypothetical protein